MELIKSNNTITKAVPKIVETPRHLALNSQIYDKLTFKPHPMKFFTRELGSLLSLNTSINRTTNYFSDMAKSIETLYNNENNHINIIQDKNNTDIFYALRPYGLELNESYIFEKTKYDPITGDYTVMNSINLGTIVKPRTQAKIIYENTDSIILYAVGRDVINSIGNGYIVSAIIIVNKENFGYSMINSGTDQYAYFLNGIDDTIYILRISAIGNNASECYINKLNITTKQYTQIYQYPQTSNLFVKRTACNPVKIGDDFYMLFTHMEDTAYFYKIMKTNIDTTTDTVTTELLDIDLNGYILDNSGSLNYGSSLIQTLRVIETENDVYLSLLIHTYANAAFSADLYKQCKHALIKMQDNTFTVVNVMDLHDGCFGSLNYYDTKHQIFFTQNSLIFTIFNETREKMEITYQKSGKYSQIGFDSLNRFISHSETGVIEIISEGNASTLYANFEYDIYDKEQNHNIDAKVQFYAKNFLDQYIDTNVKLTLIGSVVFKENEEQELIISSSSEGIKEVPVTITGFGNIEVIITQNT